MGKRQRPEIEKIADPAAQRRKGLLKEASDSEICHLCGDRATVHDYSSAGEPYCFGDPESLIVKNESVRELALNSLEDVEKMIGAGGGTGAHGCNCGFHPDDFLGLFGLEDRTNEGDDDSFSTSPAITSEGSGEESTSCNLEGYRYDPDDFLSLFDLENCTNDGEDDSFSTFTSEGSGEETSCNLEGYGYDFLSLSDLEDCINQGDDDSFSTLTSEGSGEETSCNLEGYGYDFLSLSDLEDCINDGDDDSFSSAITSESSGEETSCNLEGYRYDPDDVLALEDVDETL